MRFPANSPKRRYANNEMGDSQPAWQSSHKHVESAELLPPLATEANWSTGRKHFLWTLLSLCFHVQTERCMQKPAPGMKTDVTTGTSTCRSAPQTRASNCLNSLPSGRTIGISGAAPSAERDPDSLEREDDSLFPACLLELFLSHISSAKSPPFFFLCLYSSQSLTHDLFAPSESTAARSEAPVQTRVPTDWALSRHFAGDQVQKEAITSTTYDLM